MDRRFRIQAAALALLTFLAYLPALRGGFIWDDREYVQNNPTLRTDEGLSEIWTNVKATPQYYPLVHTTFWFEYRLWELNPHGYHTTNVLLHAVNVLLLWRLLRLLAVPGAWIAAAIFAVHPVEVESVAWITERKNVLSGLFYLSAALCFLTSTDPQAGISHAARRRRYVFSIVLYVAALLSKTVTASLPAALLLVRWCRTGRITRKDVVLTLPMFAIGIPLALLTAWLEKNHVGAQGPEWDFSFADRCLIAGRALWFYAGKLAWPHPLIFFYPRWKIDSAAIWQYAYPAAFVVVVIGLWLLRRRIGRGPITAVLFFAGTLFPALGFFNVYPMRFSFVADHFQYLASIGLITLTAAGGTLLARRFPKLENTGRGALVAVLATLSVLTWCQGHVYKDLDSLWADTTTKNPDAFIAWVNWGDLRRQQGRIDEAIVMFRKSLALKREASMHNDLGGLLLGKGEFEEAQEQFELALKLDPKYALAYNNLGILYYEHRDHVKALENFEKAVALDPKNALAQHNLGALREAVGRLDEAVESYKRALALMPDNAMSHANLGRLYVRRGDRDRGIRHLIAALKLEPDLQVARDSLEQTLGSGQR